MNTKFPEISLPGLSGSSLLGFMAALGAFRTLAELPSFADLKLKWSPAGSSYIPILRSTGLADRDSLVDQLHTTLSATVGHPAFTIDKDLKISGERYRNFAKKTAEDFLEGDSCFSASMAAAYGCDSVVNEAGQIEDTAFRTMSGAGHQHFLQFMDILARETTFDQLREALFGPWLYRDPSPTMRWDAEDDRRYALRWDEPSGDPVRTVRGANRLAIASLPFFPVVPEAGGNVATTGFRGRGSKGTFITWPIWSAWISLNTARSLLALTDLQSESPAALLRPRGVVAVYRSQRITLGKYRNFTPSEAV